MSDLWYVRTGKRDRGPYETEKLRKLAAEGKLQPEMLVSRDAKQTWVKASELKGFEFGTKPPKKRKKRKRPDDDFLPQYGGGQKARRSRDIVQNYGDQLAAAGDRALARLAYSGSFAAGAALVVYFLVRVSYFIGLVNPETIGGSLAVRIGLPAGAFVLTFVAVWFYTGWGAGQPGIIDPDMSDEEIAEALKGQ